MFDFLETRTSRVALWLGASVLALAAAGCGTAKQPFEPIHASGTAGATYPTASYDLKIGTTDLGNATVWSEGAVTGNGGDPNGRRLDVQMTIRNATATPLRLDVRKSRVDVETHDGKKAALGAPVGLGGSQTVGPETSGRVALQYALPSGMAMSDVKEFYFNWRVASPAGEYQQLTIFVPSTTPVSEDLSDRFASCNGVRIATLDECVDAPPPTTSPPQ
jgi:hypothetical protein